VDPDHRNDDELGDAELPRRRTATPGPRPSDPLFSTDEAAALHAVAQDTLTRRAPTPLDRLAPRVDTEQTAPTNIYRARRPAVAFLLIVPAAAVGLLIVRALAISAFGRPFLIDGVIASSLMLAALPLLVLGLYGLITGAAHGAEQWGFRVWARPPLAYLVVGLAFATAAAVAIG
jgi:hypothetical protein